MSAAALRYEYCTARRRVLLVVAGRPVCVVGGCALHGQPQPLESSESEERRP